MLVEQIIIIRWAYSDNRPAVPPVKGPQGSLSHTTSGLVSRGAFFRQKTHFERVFLQTDTTTSGPRSRPEAGGHTPHRGVGSTSLPDLRACGQDQLIRRALTPPHTLELDRAGFDRRAARRPMERTGGAVLTRKNSFSPQKRGKGLGIVDRGLPRESGVCVRGQK